MLKLIRKALRTVDRISDVGNKIVDGVEEASEVISESIEDIADELVWRDEERNEERDEAPKVSANEPGEELFEMQECERGSNDGCICPGGGDAETTEAEPEAKGNADSVFPDDAQKTVSSLLEEIDSLREEIARLNRLKSEESRILAEINDFCALFPDVKLESLPDEVWEEVRKGAPLAASFALYEKKSAARAKRIAQINSNNATRAAGIAGTDAASEYFSPEDVRRMSRAEVHANYSKIKESMKKWMQK